MAAQIDLGVTFANAIAVSTRHTRMEALYDALAHLSDSLSGLVSRPRIGEDGAGAEALEALDDFIMHQMDAVKDRAMVTQPVDSQDEEARVALLMKHVARFRLDTAQMADVIAQIESDLATSRSGA